MTTKQALAIAGDFPITLWNDHEARDAGCWGSLYNQAEAIATEYGKTLAGEIDRTVRYMRIVDGPGGEAKAVETTPDQAEIVNLLLRMWAQ